PRFEAGIQPILQNNCVPCHGDKVRMKDLNVGSYEALMKGSESGSVIVPGKPDESRLYQLIQEGKMPMGKPRLPEKDIAVIRSWIEDGAHGASGAKKAETAVLTQHDVLPVLLLRCTVCHGLRRQEAGLDLHTRAAMLKGGKSGPAL